VNDVGVEREALGRDLLESLVAEDGDQRGEADEQDELKHELRLVAEQKNRLALNQCR